MTGQVYSVGCAKCGQYVELEDEATAQVVMESMKGERSHPGAHDLFGRQVEDHDHEGLAVVVKEEGQIF